MLTGEELLRLSNLPSSLECGPERQEGAGPGFTSEGLPPGGTRIRRGLSQDAVSLQGPDLVHSFPRDPFGLPHSSSSLPKH